MNVGKPLPRKAHPKAATKVSSTNVARSTHQIVDGSKHVNKPVNAHNQNPGFKGKVV